MLLSANAITSCKSNTTTQSKTETVKGQDGRDSLIATNDTLQAQNNAAHAAIDQYATITAKLDSQIRLKDKAIAQLKSTNGHLESNNRKLAAELKTDKKLIASMREDLKSNAIAYEQQLGLLENDRNDLLRQRDSLLAKYNKVVALGSVLHASNIRLTAIHLKRNGKEKDTKRARRADELRVDFDIDENRIAADGTKKLYLVIKDPTGKLLSSPAAGSGSTTSSKGSPIDYSVLKEVPLTTGQPVNNISVEWKQAGDYEKGDYTVTIYNEGYRIGGGQIELK